VLAAHDGSLVKPASKLNGDFPFNPEHQEAWLRRPHPIVADPLPLEDRMFEPTDRVFKFTLARIVLRLSRRDRARIKGGDVCPRPAPCRAQERIQRWTHLAHSNHKSTLLRVSAEAGPPIGSEKRVVGHGSGPTLDPGTGLDEKHPYPPY
jgi:hypothetical protein